MWQSVPLLYAKCCANDWFTWYAGCGGGEVMQPCCEPKMVDFNLSNQVSMGLRTKTTSSLQLRCQPYVFERYRFSLKFACLALRPNHLCRTFRVTGTGPVSWVCSSELCVGKRFAVLVYSRRHQSSFSRAPNPKPSAHEAGLWRRMHLCMCEHRAIMHDTHNPKKDNLESPAAKNSWPIFSKVAQY